MAKIIFLGTSSSIPTEQRDNTSFVFIHEKYTFLIDCPGSVTQKLIKVGINFKKIKNIIITHEHPDHIYGIISLIHTQMHFNDSLTIFSNASSIKIIKQLVKLFKLNDSHYPKIKYINVFKKKVFFQEANIKLQALKNNHIKDSFGIKISFAKKSIFYSSDTSFSHKMLKQAENFNYLIHDCTASSDFFKKHPSLYKMHTCSKTLSDYLINKPSIKLIPIHFLLLEKNEMKRIRNELKPLGKRVVFVKDFYRLSL